MESSSQENGGKFYWALRDLKFSPAPWGQMGGLNLSHFFGWGQQGFLYWEGSGGVPPPLAKNLLIPPPPGKVPQ